MDLQSIANEIINIYEVNGQLQYGEEMTQLQHAFQSAALAASEGYDEEVQLAAFLHDIGHFMNASDSDKMGVFGVKSHEKLGAEYLRAQGFSEKVAALVEGHVAAKRYLTFKESGYYEQLSEASKRTLEYQGGRMTAAEAQAFEVSPFFEMSVKMRYWDDAGKNPDLPIESLERYREMIVTYLEKR